MLKGKRNTISVQDDTQADWVAEQFQVLCQNLLSRPASRRGPFVIDDNDLKTMITKGGRVGKIRGPAATADSDEGGQLFRLKADSISDRLRTAFR